jgi:hypothetical protein
MMDWLAPNSTAYLLINQKRAICIWAQNWQNLPFIQDELEW